MRRYGTVKDNSPMRVPVAATMRRNADGSYSMINAEWAEITPEQFARFLIMKFGITPWEKVKPD